MSPMTPLRRLRDCSSGATAVEFAIVSLFLVLVSIGVIDFGRGFYVRNHMSYAADMGARKALIDATASEATLESTIRDAFTGPSPDLLEVTIGSETITGVTYRIVTMAYPLALKIPGMTDSPVTLNVARRIPVL